MLQALSEFILKNYQISICCFIILILCFILWQQQQKSRRLQQKSLEDDILHETHKQQLRENVATLQNLNDENKRLLTENATLKAEMENQAKYLNARYNDIVQTKEDMALKFRDISNEILKSQNQHFSEEQKNTFQLLFKPFQDQIVDFRQKVEQAQQETRNNKTAFDTQMAQLFTLNQNLSKDAKDLSDALKGNKKLQGNWGEFQLERVLEISGLQKGLNYTTQETFKNDENQMLRPDVIVRLPNERSVIVDSKVSLNDYLNYVNAEDENIRQEYLKKHIQCIKNHIDELSSKDYQKLLKSSSLDYVVIFIPIESAYVEAVRADSGLYDYAYRKNIAVTTPSSLLPILRTIENLWMIESQNKYVAEIATIGGSLYDKIVGFVEDMQRIDKSIDTARKNYDLAINKLSTGKGNVLSLAGRLKERGAKATKSLGLDYEETELLPSSGDQIKND